MQKSPLSFAESESAIGLQDLTRQAEGWLLSGEIDQHSPATITIRRELVKKLLWFLQKKNYPVCGVQELRAFLSHVTNGHREPGGRFGNPRLTKPVRPRTVHTYHGHLRTLFRWLVSEGIIEASPMERIPVPTARADQVQPFTTEQIEFLLAAAKRSRHPRRDEAIVLFLLDTGVRASELCGLTLQDVDISGKRCTVMGKGNKRRTVYFGKTAARALWQYLRQDERAPEDPVFQSERGEPLTRSGLLQLIERLGQVDDEAHANSRTRGKGERARQITVVDSNIHKFRHTFAVEFLRGDGKAGGNIFALKELLGHTSLSMVNRYLALAQADLAAQHRANSPADRLKRKSK